MRTLSIFALLIALGACNGKPRAEPASPPPNRDPYRNVTPQKIKKQVEDTQKKEDERNDKVLENAR